MLNYTNTITKEKSYSGLQMTEIKPIMKLIVRGKRWKKYVGTKIDYSNGKKEY